MRKAVNAEITEIRDLWRASQANQKYVDTFMQHIFDVQSCYVEEVDGALTDALFYRNEVLALHGRNVKVSTLTSLTDSDALMTPVLDLMSRQSLLTLIYSENSERYKPFGFEPVVECHEYIISADDVLEFPITGIVVDPKPEDCLDVYRFFSSHFTGYTVRTALDFQNMMQATKKMGGQIIGLKRGQSLVGYCVYYKYASHVKVVECCYDKSGTLLHLLSFASRGMTRIQMFMSTAEKIQRILPQAKYHKRVMLLARINDQDLFERLFHIKIISAYSGFHAFGKPSWNRDLMEQWW